MSERAKSNNKRLVLLMLAAAVPFGIIEGFMGLPEPEPILLTLAEGVVINFIFFYWFLVDSEIKNYKASGFLKVMVVALGPIALSLYMIRTRGVKASVRSLLYSLGLLFLSGSVLGIVGLAISALVGQ